MYIASLLIKKNNTADITIMNNKLCVKALCADVRKSKSITHVSIAKENAVFLFIFGNTINKNIIGIK